MEKNQITSLSEKVAEYTVSEVLWNALESEIGVVVAQIDSGADLQPEDVKRVRALHKQVDDYSKSFNRAMREVQNTYKSEIATRLAELGYAKIDNYIAERRKAQVELEASRTTEKMNMLKFLIDDAVGKTTYTKHSVLANDLLSIFISRFPKVNSGAKDKDITKWGPYETVIAANLAVVEEFFAHPSFPNSYRLPLSSHVMQRLLAFLRSGNRDELFEQDMATAYANDKHCLELFQLEAVITTKEIALQLIQSIVTNGGDADQQLERIATVLNIARAL